MWADYRIDGQLSGEEKQFITQQWEQIAVDYRIPPAMRQKLFYNLSLQYQQAGRHYHNERHIYQLLRLAEAFRAKIADYSCFRLAIFYHDLVYQPNRKDNEQQSWTQAQVQLSDYLPTADLERLKCYILSTAGHEPLDTRAETQLLLDFDLSILGSKREIYQQYSEAVAKEYLPYYPAEVYRQGRRLFVENQLQRAVFFRSEGCQGWNEQALSNLRWELSSL